MFAGCGGSDGLPIDDGTDGGGKNLSLFIGTWTPTSGTESFNCAGQTDPNPVDSNTIWQAGTTSDLVQPPDPSGCSLLANVSGRTATALPNQSCSGTMNGITIQLTLTSYMFTVAAGGTTATESGSGNAVATGPVSVTCTFTENATYSKGP